MNLIPIVINNGIVVEDQKLEPLPLTFNGLKIEEKHIEEFLRKNIDIIVNVDNNEGENLLIVGQQVVDTEDGRNDLVAIDKNGSIVLIEIKRDLKDIVGRKEPLEFQAIRYAASYAKIKNPEDLVNKVFSKYIEKHREEFGQQELNPNELGKRKLKDFLDQNKNSKFNQKQRIFLVAASFDDQTLSTVAWMVSNGIDISCFEISPTKIDEKLYLNIEKILPITSIEEFYTDIPESSSLQKDGKEASPKRTDLPRMPRLFEWGILKNGDRLTIMGYDDSEAEVIDENNVKFNDKTIGYNDWGKKVTGWSSIGIYTQAIHKRLKKTLDELRKEKLEDVDVSHKES